MLVFTSILFAICPFHLRFLLVIRICFSLLLLLVVENEETRRQEAREPESQEASKLNGKNMMKDYS